MIILLATIYICGFISNIIGAIFNYSKIKEFGKFVASENASLEKKRKELEDEIERFNQFVISQNMKEFFMEQKSEGKVN